MSTSRWYVKQGDFYSHHPLNIVGERFHSESYSVVLFNASLYADIISIQVFTTFEKEDKNKAIHLAFTFSPCNAKKIEECVSSSTKSNSIKVYRRDGYSYCLTFTSYKEFSQASTLLGRMNDAFGKTLFSDDLIAELKQMSDFLSKSATSQLINQGDYRCRFPFLPKEHNRISIKQKYSHMPIFDFIIGHTKSLTLNDKETAEDFAALLAEGVDPNEVHRKFRFRALYIAVKIAQEEGVFYFMDLLLYYGANPLSRDAFAEWSEPHSALDLALQYGNANIFGRITATLQTPQRSPKYSFKNLVSTQRGRAIYSTVDVCRAENQAVIDSLKIELTKPVQRDIALEERIIQLSKSTFEYTPKPDEFRSMMLADINTPNRLVEMIQNKDGHDIGFNLYEIIILDNKIIWYCSTSLITGELRSSGIMSVLALRNAYALQMLNPSATVGVYLLTIHPNSFKIVQDASMRMPRKVYWPKYRTPMIEELMHELLYRINVLPNCKYVKNAPACFVDGQFSVKEAQVKLSPYQKFINEIFYRYLLSEDQVTSNKAKAIPLLFFISDEYFSEFMQTASSIGINIRTHLNTYCIALEQFLTLTKLLPTSQQPLPPVNVIRNTYQLFCNDDARPTTTLHLSAFQREKSKL